MERLQPDHRFRWGLTQPPLTEYSLKKNNPPEACNSRGRLFLRATLPGARREWLSEPVMASAFRPHIAAPLLSTQPAGSTHHGMCRSDEILGLSDFGLIQGAFISRLERCPGRLPITCFNEPLFSDSAAPLLRSACAKSVPAPRFNAWGREFFCTEALCEQVIAPLRCWMQGSCWVNTNSFADQGIHFLDLFQNRGSISMCWLRGTD